MSGALPRALTVTIVPGSYKRPAYLTDERGRIIASIVGDQLDPKGLSIGEAGTLAAEIARRYSAFEAMREALDEALGFVVAAKIAGQAGRSANTLPPPFALETKIRRALDAGRQP